MMNKDEVLRLALEALKGCRIEYGYHGNPMDISDQDVLNAITAIKAALEAKDEPVAWLHRFIEGGISIGLKPLDLERHPERWEPLYTNPPQRKPLTDEQVDAIWPLHTFIQAPDRQWLAFARAIEAAHGIKGEA